MKFQRIATVGTAALLCGTLITGVCAPASAAQTGVNEQSIVQQNWAGGVTLRVRNMLNETITVEDIIEEPNVVTQVASGETAVIYGSRASDFNVENPLNWAIAKVTTSKGTFSIEAMNGAIGYPSLKLYDLPEYGDWYSYFSEGEEQSAKAAGWVYQFNREADGDRVHPGWDEHMKNFTVLIKSE